MEVETERARSSQMESDWSRVLQRWQWGRVCDAVLSL